MSHHTKGPWFVNAEDGADFTAISTNPNGDGSIEFEKEVLGSSEWLRVKPEDLRLMAAGPELLEAAKLALDIAVAGQFRVLEKTLRAAIKKAEGDEGR